MSAYKLIDAEKASFPVAVLCKAVLNVSRSGYYDCRDRPPSPRARENAALVLARSARSTSAAEGPTARRGSTLSFAPSVCALLPESGWLD